MDDERAEKFRIPVWVTLCVGVAIHSVVAVAWLFATFQTIAHAIENKTDLKEELQEMKQTLKEIRAYQIQEMKSRIPAGK